MSYVDPFHCQHSYSAEFFAMYAGDVEEIEEAIRNTLLADMSDYAQANGFSHFTTEAVRVVRTLDNESEMISYVASWCPDSNWPIEFEGGILDGKVESVPDAKRKVQYPIVIDDPAWGRYLNGEQLEQLPPTVRYRKVAYKRAGINPVTQRWVYVPN